jgi:hypothetical protein
MATNIDLTWADKDALWAKYGLFIIDETYKFMYDCQRQVFTPSPSPPIAAELVDLSSSLPRIDTATIVKTTFTTLPSPLQVFTYPIVSFPQNLPPARHSIEQETEVLEATRSTV